jgi:hypothetical protein
MSHWKRILAGSTGALSLGRFLGELVEVVRVKVPEGGIPVEEGLVVEEPGGPEFVEEGAGGAEVPALAEAEVLAGAKAPIGVLVVLWLVPWVIWGGLCDERNKETIKNLEEFSDDQEKI